MRRAIRVLGLLLLAAGPLSAQADEPTLPGRVADQPGRRDLQAGGDYAGRDVRQPADPAREGGHEGEDGDAQLPGRAEARRRVGDARRLRPVVLRAGISTARASVPSRAGPGTAGGPTPRRTRGETGRFDGLWLTTSGLMELEQAGDKVKGQYARYGPVKIEGTITGRRLDFRYDLAAQRQGLVRPEQGRQDARGRGRRRRDGFLVRVARPPGARSSAGTRRSRPARSSTGPPRTCSPTASAPPRATRTATRSDGRPSSSSTGRT